jgi:hypothetical protein
MLLETLSVEKSTLMCLHIMLCHEDYVKEYACIRKKQFDWIARQAIPIGLKGTIYEELQKRGDSASKVKQNLVDTPALG